MAAVRLEGRTLAVVTHVYVTGPADALERYARERAERVVYIGHAFSYAAEVNSRLRIWRRGQLVRRRTVRRHAGVPEPVTWVKDFILTVAWALSSRKKIDVFIGIDSLNAAAGLLLRRLGRVHKVVFWTIDYVPERFPNPLLNFVYHHFDRLCVTRCDVTWNVSPRMEPARRERGLVGPQRIVEVGANITWSPAEWNRKKLVFVGHLLEKQGVQLVLRALPEIRQAVPDVSFQVIGDGPYRDDLVRLAHELDVDDVVEFTGYIRRHEEVEQLLAGSAVGLAMYDPLNPSFTKFADPGKVKTYFGAGVPVAMTDVAHNAAELSDADAAVVVPYEVGALATTLAELLNDPARQAQMRAAARRMGERSSWIKVLDRAFEELLDEARPPSSSTT
jgi:glycosyltransferase involved in cell wall biosynthesis